MAWILCVTVLISGPHPVAVTEALRQRNRKHMLQKLTPTNSTVLFDDSEAAALAQSFLKSGERVALPW